MFLLCVFGSLLYIFNVICVFLFIIFFFFFKQKTAYEMRISDWSSDVCSSDLDVDDSRDGVGAIDCRSTVGDDLDPLDRRSRYRADIDHALRTAVSKPVAIEKRPCGAGPDAPQVEGRCPVDVYVLVLCALPRTDTGVRAAASILRQVAQI